MSSDTSPPSGYRLDNPARTAGAIGSTGSPAAHGTPTANGSPIPIGVPTHSAHRPNGSPASNRSAAPQRQVAAAPSWITVIATTLRLWVRRRILRVPDSGRIGMARRTGIAAVIVVVVAAVAVAVVLALPASTPARQHQATAPKLTPAQKQARAAAAAQVAANSSAAAGWIAQQVSQQTVIGCDPATCAAIVAAGYGGGGQVVLQPGVRLPSAGAVIVATPVVRAQFGAQLTAAAPAVIAAFGSGSQAVQVREVVPGGQAAYGQAASAAVAARRSAGLRLIANDRVHARSSARDALTDGLVDSRLLAALGKLAARYPVYINHFSDAGPLADSSVPYRLALIVGLTSQHGRGQASELASVEDLLADQPAGSRPALAAIPLPGGKYALRIQFPAPSPT